MHPRTLAIVAVLLLAGSLGLRYLVVRFGLLPVSEEVVLKKAVALTVSYYDGGRSKTCHIAEPALVQEVLTTLKIYQGDEPFSYGRGSYGGTQVEFQFPNGYRRAHALDGVNLLGGFKVDGDFYRKLTEIVSREEGHVVDLMRRKPFAMERDDIEIKGDWKK